MTVKAIETKYAGCRFRSHLEARWAVFFDALGLKWEYEPQGFERDGEMYLPDFLVWVGKKKVWVEVKGDPDWWFNNKSWISNNFQQEPIVPLSDDREDGLIVLGPIPRLGSLLICPVILRGGGIYWRLWNKKSPHLSANALFAAFYGNWPKTASKIYEGFDFSPRMPDTPYCDPDVRDAIAAALSARFEHGERG